MGNEDDHYKTLGLEPDASSIDIKKAYRKLALKFHPDKQQALSDKERESACSQFAKIAAAYEVLSDDEERKQYDLRRKYGGGPGTIYTTHDISCNSPLQRTKSRQMNSSSRPAKADANYSEYNSTTPSSFQFSYDPSKVKSRDPQEIFREVFGKDFNIVHPGATMTSHVQKSPSTHCPKGKKIATTSSGKGQRSPSTHPPTTARVKPKENLILKGDEDITSISSSTRTISHPDGSQEVITETTITLKDGSKQTKKESSRSFPSKARRQVHGAPQQKTTYINAS